jgi:hypothetical protein
MPAPPLVPNVYQVTHFGTLYNKTCDKVLHYLVAGSSATPTSIANAFASNDAKDFMAHFGASFSPNFSIDQCRCIYLGDTTSTPGIDVTALTGTDIGGSRLPAQCCATIRHTYPGRGRGKDGRNNIADLRSTDMDPLTAFKLTDSAQGRIQASWDAYQAAVKTDVEAAIGGTVSLVILDRKLGTYTHPIASLVDPYMNTHRRWVKRLARH